MKRSGLIVIAALAPAALNIAATAPGNEGAMASGNERVIKITARRFSYSPDQIVLKKGEAVRLEFTSLDFVHGFKVPDLGIRADLPPGVTTSVRLQPDKTGSYAFLCDNFCGAGHEEMHGKIIVQD